VGWVGFVAGLPPCFTKYEMLVLFLLAFVLFPCVVSFVFTFG